MLSESCPGIAGSRYQSNAQRMLPGAMYHICVLCAAQCILETTFSSSEAARGRSSEPRHGRHGRCDCVSPASWRVALPLSAWTSETRQINRASRVGLRWATLRDGAQTPTRQRSAAQDPPGGARSLPERTAAAPAAGGLGGGVPSRGAATRAGLGMFVCYSVVVRAA
jgi:hypothetical protein